MALSRRQIDTLIELVDIEIKILDDHPDDGVGTRRIPQLQAARTELVDLAAAGRARYKKAFADISWKKIRPWNRLRPTPTLEVPEPPQEARVTGSTGTFLRKHG